MGVAPSSGVYLIQSAAYNTQYISLTGSGIVVGSHKGSSLGTREWTVGIAVDAKGNVTNSLRNVANKRYLAVDAKHKLTTSEKPFDWFIRTIDKTGHYVIFDNTVTNFVLQPSGPSDGAVLMFTKPQNLPIQHWNFIRLAHSA